MKEKAKVMKKLLGALAVAFVMTMVLGMVVSAAPASKYISSGKWVVNSELNGSVAHYYKVTVKSTGSLAITGLSQNYYGYQSGLYVTLCNANGKALDSQQYVRATEENQDYWTIKYYGVKKGTYLIKVQTSDEFALQYSFKALTGKGGSSQKKATTLKKGKLMYGISTIGTKNRKIDYYKIKLTKTQKQAKFQIINYNHNNSTLKYKIIWPKGITAVSKSAKTVSNGSGYTVELSLSRGKLPKGTYYIQVIRSSKKASVNGFYSIKRTK